MYIHIPFHPSFIFAVGTVLVFVLVKSLIELIPL